MDPRFGDVPPRAGTESPLGHPNRGNFPQNRHCLNTRPGAGPPRIDELGRVGDRAMTAVLGWQAGDRLTFTAAAGVVVARRDPGGVVTMPAKPYLVILAALRRRCGLRPGDHVLLAASPGQDMLTAYSFAVVDQALRAHAPLPGGGGRRA